VPRAEAKSTSVITTTAAASSSTTPLTASGPSPDEPHPTPHAQIVQIATNQTDRGARTRGTVRQSSPEGVVVPAGTRTPWETIRAGVIEPTAARTFDYRAAVEESPCDSCTTATCCTYLPLHTFEVSTLMDVSYLGYLLNFDRIRLGLSSTGKWSVYYVEPCGFLDKTTLRCTVHGTAKQPRICSHYNPYSCWYRPALGAMVTDDFVLVDRTRFAWLRERFEFDDARRLSGVPSWPDTLDAFAELSDDRGAPERDTRDPVRDEWVHIAVTGRPKPPPPPDPTSALDDDSTRTGDPSAATETTETPETPATSVRPYAGYESVNRCDDCSAPCCDTITFGQAPPTSVSSLDHLRFSLGFPGIELLIDETQWWVVVKTPCQHLDNGRCGVFGKPERPLQCTFYDAAKCTYVGEFGTPRPTGALRVKYEDFERVTEGIAVDGDGRVVGIEPVAWLRERVESRWREEAAARA
jgi:hypothetical protein